MPSIPQGVAQAPGAAPVLTAVRSPEGGWAELGSNTARSGWAEPSVSERLVCGEQHRPKSSPEALATEERRGRVVYRHKGSPGRHRTSSDRPQPASSALGVGAAAAPGAVAATAFTAGRGSRLARPRRSGATRLPRRRSPRGARRSHFPPPTRCTDPEHRTPDTDTDTRLASAHLLSGPGAAGGGPRPVPVPGAALTPGTSTPGGTWDSAAAPAASSAT